MACILGIETATRVCSTAVVDGEEVIGEFSLSVPHVHVEKLVLMVNQLLENLHLRYSDLDAVAVSNGPGSFTGVRIGLSVAKGIAFAHSTKLIAVPTLDAIAHEVVKFAENKAVVPLLHARAEEFYYSAYRSSAGIVSRVKDYAAAEGSTIVSEFDEETLFVGEGVHLFSRLSAVLSKPEAEVKNIAASARGVALIGAEKCASEEFADIKTLVPLYIKDFVAVKRNKLTTA